MRKSIVTVILLASAASAIAQTSTPSRPLAKAAKGPVATKDANKPQIGDFGFDMAGRDTSVTPGTDFFDYANGGWVKATPIPADRSSYGMFHVLQDLSLARTRTILDAAATKRGDKVGDFYTSFMDEAAVNAKGATPVKPMLAALKATKDKTALVTEIARLQRQLDAAGLLAAAFGIRRGLRGLPVDFTRVEHGVAATPDVDKRRLHAREHVLHAAEVDVADEARLLRTGDVVLNEHVVFEHGDLDAVVLAAHDHRAIDRLATGEELALGHHRAAATTITAFAATLLLRLEAG